jgi:hypothetical protein
MSISLFSVGHYTAITPFAVSWAIGGDVNIRPSFSPLPKTFLIHVRTVSRELDWILELLVYGKAAKELKVL